jgi:serine/threonine protein kinase
MNQQEISFKGNKSTYIVSDTTPIGLGRDSVIMATEGGNGICVKAYRWYVELNPKFHDFYGEITARKLLSHPNILPVLDYGISEQPDYGPFLVLPVCKSGSLRDLLDKRDYLSLSILLPILEQVAIAIDYAHQNGVIHGDIKPENILFPDSLSQACLSDFGGAKFFPVVADITDIGPSGPGTTAYLSPEQIFENKQTPISDIYSLATVAYEGLTGKLPFDTSGTAYQQMDAKVKGKLIYPSESNHLLSSEVSEALMVGLSVNPKDRPKTSIDFCNLLREEIGKGDELLCFLSYSRTNETIAERLRSELQSMDIKVWRDVDDIPAGSSWDNQVAQAIISCSHVLFLVTAKSVQSQNVADELSYARGEGKTIIPLLFEDTKLPLRVHRSQAIDFKQDYDRSFRTLIANLLGEK